jgi:hypothetical protein
MSVVNQACVSLKSTLVLQRRGRPLNVQLLESRFESTYQELITCDQDALQMINTLQTSTVASFSIQDNKPSNPVEEAQS